MVDDFKISMCDALPMVTGEYASNVDGEQDEEVRRAVESSEPVVGDGDRMEDEPAEGRGGGGGSQGAAVQDGQFTEEDEDGEEEAETAATTLEDAADDGVVRAVSLSENVESSGLYPAVVAKEIFVSINLLRDLKQLQQVNTDARVEQAIEEWFDDEHSKLTNQGYTPFSIQKFLTPLMSQMKAQKLKEAVEFEKMVLTAIRRIEKATQELDDAISLADTLSKSNPA